MHAQVPGKEKRRKWPIKPLPAPGAFRKMIEGRKRSRELVGGKPLSEWRGIAIHAPNKGARENAVDAIAEKGLSEERAVALRMKRTLQRIAASSSYSDTRAYAKKALENLDTGE